MIKLEPIIYNEDHITKIAIERNKTLLSLRSKWITEPLKQKNWIMNMNPDKERYFYIFRGNTLVGYCGLDKINLIDRNAEMSLLIFKDFNGLGFGKASVNKLIEYAICELGLYLIYIEVYKTTRNWRFWQKCGFNKDAVLNDRIFRAGKYHGVIIGSIRL